MKGAPSVARFGGWLDGFAGLPRDGFFGKPTWVDADKPAGHTSQVEELGLRKTWRAVWTLRHFFFSPNLIWFALTMLWYVCFPYDMNSAAKGWSFGWVGKRISANFALASAYYGFFFWALYIRGLGKRKFRPGYYPTFGNMVHDVWYWSLGILQWSLAECAMTRVWAVGRVPFVSDHEVLRSPAHLLVTGFWVLAVPLWRDLHFYIAHRFTHVRAVYRYVHALHHRNIDPEPFSGLCMHPVEHLIYFSSALTPVLYLRLSPLVYMWTFLHLVIGPGGGHSGFEDHWQADQYHYIHHAKFECNYGSLSSGCIDQFFGTFREKLGTSGAYRGEYKDDYAVRPGTGKVWSAQSYLGLQGGDHLAYTCFCLGTTLALVWAAALNAQSALPMRALASVPIQSAVAAMVAYGPVALALLLCLWFDKMSWRWPFHKERMLGAFGFFLLAGWAACLLPIYHFVRHLCTPQGTP